MPNKPTHETWVLIDPSGWRHQVEIEIGNTQDEQYLIRQLRKYCTKTPENMYLDMKVQVQPTT